MNANGAQVVRRGHGPPENRLLTGLPSRQLQRLTARHPIELKVADILAEPGERVRYVYFPIEGFISLISLTDRQAQLEVGLVGNEEMLGTSLILGVNVSPLRALVQGGGSAWRIDAGAFRRELALGDVLHRRLQRYLFVQMSQFAQAAACTRFHFVDARLARWILMTRDRAHSDRFYITHEFMAHMLGVRRAGVTRAANALQADKLIRYSRGDVQILDGSGLEAAACNCYAAGKEMYERVLG